MGDAYLAAEGRMDRQKSDVLSLSGFWHAQSTDLGDLMMAFKATTDIVTKYHVDSS
jgi:hypothetical protein